MRASISKSEAYHSPHSLELYHRFLKALPAALSYHSASCSLLLPLVYGRSITVDIEGLAIVACTISSRRVSQVTKIKVSRLLNREIISSRNLKFGRITKMWSHLKNCIPSDEIDKLRFWELAKDIMATSVVGRHGDAMYSYPVCQICNLLGEWWSEQ